MMHWALVFALALLPAFCRADCSHCGWTVGIRAIMDDGSVTAGYVAVNSYMYMALQDRAEKGLEPYSGLFDKGKVPRWQSVKDPQSLIEPWALLMNAGVRSGKAPEGRLAIFTELVQVVWPSPVWVAVEGSRRDLDVKDMRGISLDPSLPVRQDVTGIESLSRSAIELLKGEPAVSVKIFGDVSDSYLLIYDTSVDLARLPLDLMAHGDEGAGIEIGGVTLSLRGSPQVEPLALPAAAEGLSADQKKVVRALQEALLRGHIRMLASSTLNSLSYTAKSSQLLPEEKLLMDQLGSYLGKPEEVRAAGLKEHLLRHKIVYYTLGFD